MKGIISKGTLPSFFGSLKSYVSRNRCFVILLAFLFAIVVVSFVIPFLNFGRLYGTDDYTHLFHTGKMSEAPSLNAFFQNMGSEVSNAGSAVNPYNYPFGLWLYGSEVIKMTGLSSIDGTFVFTLIFLFVLIGCFYFYSGFILATKEQKLIATLFFISMPNMALLMLSYRPSVFILPFLFLILYFAYKDAVDWKMTTMMMLSIFVIVISHTGTFIFLLIFSILFFLMYCLIWGKFSVPFYITILGTFVIYAISLNWFPQISGQYEDKASVFLTTGNFFATKFHFALAGDLGKAFYENLFVGQQVIYALMFAAIIFMIAKAFLYIHNRAAAAFTKKTEMYPLTLPISNISHSAAATPFWIGPVQSLFSLVGIFLLDSKGKCLLIAALICAVLPDQLQSMQGVVVDTGALREVSFLVIIIPITATLGFFELVRRLKESKNAHKKLISFTVWGLVLSSMIITPAIATTYYLPKIAGEDYVIDGMKWLGQIGNSHDSVAGYGYRPVPIYTNMTDASYGLQSGTETRTFYNLLDGIYTSNDTGIPDTFQSVYGAKYVMSSDKILSNFRITRQNLTIDNNTALDKIYGSNDFGIYEITSSSGLAVAKQYIADNVSLENVGSSLEVDSPVYRITLDAKSPAIERIGTAQQNLLGDGYSSESIRISGTGNASSTNQYNLLNLNFTRSLEGNRISYQTILQDTGDPAGQNLATLRVVYTFYPEMVKREFLVSNDWQDPVPSPEKSIYFSTDLFTPLSDFVVKSELGRQERHIYESEDSITKSNTIQDIYVHTGDSGIYLRYGTTSPYPTSLSYRGSTIYNNMSALSIYQTEHIKPGASLHITQFLSVGDEQGAEQNIAKHEGITLMNYPRGITPIIVTGIRTPMTDQLESGAVNNGYGILSANDIPFSEAVSLPDPPVAADSQSQNPAVPLSYEPGAAVVQNVSPVVLPRIDLKNLAMFGINDIIGVQKTGGATNYDDYETQKQNIDAVVSYASGEGTPLAGFMPSSLDYDLDTVKIISDDQIPLAYTLPVSPPYPGIPDTGSRSPEMAYYQGNPANVVFLPVSYPMSTSLMFEPDKEQVFSSWTETIDRAAKSGEMVIFMLRANDIGNPQYTADFVNLTDHAKEKGLTFTTPDSIADHFQKIQNIEYSGTIENDKATLQVTNNNPDPVTDVAFRVSMPAIRNGDYTVDNATIVRTSAEGGVENLIVDTSLLPSDTKTVVVRPAQERKDLVVRIPAMPIEGRQTLFVNDTEGNPMPDVDVLIDAKHYRTDESGILTVELTRGTHTITVQSPGYNPVTRRVDVSGRAVLVERFIRSF